MVIEYRSFRNSDPPRLLGVWHACRLGRGAVEGIATDAFELLNFAQPYFDPEGLILACDGAEVVGFVHAGFGPNDDESGLSHETGVVCAVLVHPDHRRRGIGRELVARAENYLRSHGSINILAGPAPPYDPFYVGLYGGVQPAGFLESDPDAAPFFQAVGFQPVERRAVLQRDIVNTSDPVSFRQMTLRRKMELAVADSPERMTWWWLTRYGRLDSVRFLLVPKGGGEPVAAVTAIGLDLYLPKWNERAVGLCDLDVPRAERRKGYAQTLIVESCRRLRQELVTRVEAHAPENDPIIVPLLEKSGFERVDTGVVYRRSGELHR